MIFELTLFIQGWDIVWKQADILRIETDDIFETFHAIIMTHKVYDPIYFIATLFPISPEIPASYLIYMGHPVYFFRFKKMC